MANISYIDTHIHLDCTDFDEDRNEVVKRALEAGASKIFIPSIDLPSLKTVLDTCRCYKGFAYPMIGLHPEEVRNDWEDVILKMEDFLKDSHHPFIAIGEVGLDYYWTREFQEEQLLAFEKQVKLSIEYKLPLMIHSRKAQNEMVKILKKYSSSLQGGVFHCFTGNIKEARELLEFENFALGIGGVLTFKKSNLPDTLKDVPLERIVLETDAPYMAPVPMRGKRNESAFIYYVIECLAKGYNTSMEQIAQVTTATAMKIFSKV